MGSWFYVTYGSESWTLKKRDEHSQLVFEMSCFHAWDRLWVSLHEINCAITSIRETTKCQISIADKIKAKQLLNFGHTIPMPNYRYPKIILEGQRTRGRPPKQWIDNRISSCRYLHLDAFSLEKQLVSPRINPKHDSIKFKYGQVWYFWA